MVKVCFSIASLISIYLSAIVKLASTLHFSVLRSGSQARTSTLHFIFTVFSDTLEAVLFADTLFPDVVFLSLFRNDLIVRRLSSLTPFHVFVVTIQ